MIIRGDARNLPLPDNSVDLICTSPPYWQLRSYRDDGEHYDGQIGSEPSFPEYVDNLLACTKEWIRVLKPDGSLFVNLGDKYGRGTRTTIHGSNSKTSYTGHDDCIPTGHDKSLLGLPWRYALGCVDRLGLILRAEIVWDKPNSLPESVTDRVRRSHEQVFHFVKQQRYFSAVDEIREPHQPQSLARAGRNRFAPDLSQDGVSNPNTLDPKESCNPLGKLPGSVWSIPSAPLKPPDNLGIDHFAAYPPDLCKKIILGWSPKDVCIRCGEGRRPVSEYTGEEGRHPGGKKREEKRTYIGLSDASLKYRQITGYKCACPKPDAPANPGTILDPFGGTGTTALVADVLGRTGITVDYSADYCRLARWRINDPKQRARVLGIKATAPEILPGEVALDLDWEVS